jgi:hypothetical protein
LHPETKNASKMQAPDFAIYLSPGTIDEFVS